MVTIEGARFYFKCYRCGREKHAYSELGRTKKGMAKILNFKNNAHGSVCEPDCRKKKDKK